MLHTTTIGEQTATWRIIGDRIAMESLTDTASPHRPSYRVLTDGSLTKTPEGASGTVYFGRDNDHPDLVQVREWFPKYATLWDAVRAHYWDTVLPLNHPRFQGLGEVTALLYRR